MKKFVAYLFVPLIGLNCLCQSGTFADVIGDTYDIHLQGATNPDVNIDDIATIVGPTNVTFGDAIGQELVIGTSVYGNPGDTMNLLENQVITPLNAFTNRIDLTFSIFARDDQGNRTNWFADGSNLNGEPFMVPLMLIGRYSWTDLPPDFDDIDPNFGGGGTSYSVLNSQHFIVGTGPSEFGPYFSGVVAGPNDGFYSFAGASFGSDLSTYNFYQENGEEIFDFGEFSGFRIEISLITVPEPSSVAIVLIPLLSLCGLRRVRAI